MNKKTLVISLGVLMGVNTASVNAALSSSALLDFTPGYTTCDTTGTLCNVNGSYFAVDTQNDGTFGFAETVAISPGSDGGLIIGQTQLAGNSHVGQPDGTEIAPFDSPWTFKGVTGMHQSTSPVLIASDDGLGNVTLDFSGWGASWNGVNINLGGDSANFAGDTGLATVTCGFDCSAGDTYVLDYAAHVPSGDPSNFGSINWGIHLEGTIYSTTAVPVPAAVWLFGSGLAGLAGFARRRKLK